MDFEIAIWSNRFLSITLAGYRWSLWSLEIPRRFADRRVCSEVRFYPSLSISYGVAIVVEKQVVALPFTKFLPFIGTDSPWPATRLFDSPFSTRSIVKPNLFPLLCIPLDGQPFFAISSSSQKEPLLRFLANERWISLPFWCTYRIFH